MPSNQSVNLETNFTKVCARQTKTKQEKKYEERVKENILRIFQTNPAK
ncbi:MAG: hypothetical protein ACPL1Y_04535 [Thermoplasmata archaeon]